MSRLVKPVIISHFLWHENMKELFTLVLLRKMQQGASE